MEEEIGDAGVASKDAMKLRLGVGRLGRRSVEDALKRGQEQLLGGSR